MNDVLQINKIEQALIMNDLSKLSVEERLSYYNKVCESLGLNSLTQPFAYITLNGKLCLYAKRDATDQIRKIHGVSINIVARETIDGVYVVTARAKDKTGREDESTGAVSIANLKGDVLANAFLKAETKAKRRVTLSICGLGLLDETEVETIHEDKPQEPIKVVPIDNKIIDNYHANSSIPAHTATSELKINPCPGLIIKIIDKLSEKTKKFEDKDALAEYMKAMGFTTSKEIKECTDEEALRDALAALD